MGYTEGEMDDRGTVVYTGAMSMQLGTEADYLPAFSVDPPGILVLRHHADDSWEVRKADPQVEFSDETLTSVLTGENINDGVDYPCMRIERPVEVSPVTCFTGYMLHIDADQHVVYRIGEYNSKRHSWIARWPD